MSDTRIIKKRYIFMAVVFIGLALLLVLLPEKHTSKELKPEQLLQEINDDTRYVTTDEVAQKMMSGDAFTTLIDVRSPDEYNKYHLTGAVNIPLDSILNKDKNGNYVNEDVLNQDIVTNIFYSNGTVYANQAWVLLRRMNYKNNYVMKGGLNKWIETVIRPKQPVQTASQKEFELYNFRRAASMFFGGGTISSAPAENSAPAPIIKKKGGKKEEEGGC
ncbi:MAG: rhodanese-like domain-containing protein [Bacteroidales bacterium]|nr:rhodanese-like domain-containing protein [Bacteroidales bacterium]